MRQTIHIARYETSHSAGLSRAQRMLWAALLVSSNLVRQFFQISSRTRQRHSLRRCSRRAFLQLASRIDRQQPLRPPHRCALKACAHEGSFLGHPPAWRAGNPSPRQPGHRPDCRGGPARAHPRRCVPAARTTSAPPWCSEGTARDDRAGSSALTAAPGPAVLSAYSRPSGRPEPIRCCCWPLPGARAGSILPLGAVVPRHAA